MATFVKWSCGCLGIRFNRPDLNDLVLKDCRTDERTLDGENRIPHWGDRTEKAWEPLSTYQIKEIFKHLLLLAGLGVRSRDLLRNLKSMMGDL